MKTINRIAVALLLTATAANARIGETPEECAKRYGSVTESDPDGGRISYSTGSLRILCRFTEGKCDAVIYDFGLASLVISQDFEKRKNFTQEQSARLLNLNGDGSAWRQIGKESFGEPWHGVYHTADGKMHAHVIGQTVNIETVERYNSRLEKLKDTEVEKSLSAIGAKTTLAEPKPTTCKFPPTPEEQERIDLKNQLDALEKSMSGAGK